MKMRFKDFKILGLFQGEIKTLGPGAVKSAIIKDQVSTPVHISLTQFGSDQISDLKHHGGKLRVVHQYVSEHYQQWRKLFPANSELFNPGSFGENLSSQGVSEKDICIGDIIEVGDCLLQVTEPRRPCGTLNIRYGNHHFLEKLMQTTFYGWFYQVIRPGQITAGQTGKIVQRTHPELTLETTIRAVFGPSPDFNLCQKLIECQELSPTWQNYAGRLIPSCHN